MIGPVRRLALHYLRGVGHAPGIAGGAYATTFAGVRDQEIVLTRVTVSVVALLAPFASLAHYGGVLSGAGKAVGEDAAFEISAKCPLDMGRR